MLRDHCGEALAALLMDEINRYHLYFCPQHLTSTFRWNSFKCLCIQKPIECVATDEYTPVLVCDNTGGSIDVDCTYQQEVRNP